MNKNKWNKLTYFGLLIFFLVNILYSPFLQDDSIILNAENEQSSLLYKVNAEEDQSKTSRSQEILPNRQFLQEQWNLNMMNIGEAWADGYDGQGIKIAVLDTGFFHQHPDIDLAGGDSVFSDDPWSNDHSGHGTHISGIIAAKNQTSYQGLAPGADVYGIKIYHANDINEFGDVSTDVESVIKGIQLAMARDVDIIVISSGLNYHDESLYQKIKEAHQQGTMIIAASGNGNLAVNYPANYQEVIAVTAIDEDLNPALDIIYGQENEFSAPGVNIGGLSIPESSYSYPYIYMSGSSQATPHVASLAAILMQKYNKRGEEIRQIMQEQAIEIGDPGLFGYGLVYYQSNESQNKKKEDTDQSSTKAEEKPDDEKTSDPDDEESEVRKPSSSRGSVDEENYPIIENELVATKEIQVSITTDHQATIDGNDFPDVEMGGLLDINMRGAKTLELKESQIADIRQKNLTLRLRKKGISWKIPPANFVPGQAKLRFYKGLPVGIPENPSIYSNVYTISIFQARTRQGIYPGWMEVQFDIDEQQISDPAALTAAYYDNSQNKWLSLERAMSDDKTKIILKTKHTGALGFFDRHQKMNLQTDKDQNENSFNNISVISIGIIAVLVVTIIIKRLIKK